MKHITAEVRKFTIGPVELMGLMSEDGEFGFAVPQLASLELVPRNRSVKQLEAMLGEVFPSHRIEKWQTPLNSKPVNVIPVSMWTELLMELDRRGNMVARSLNKAIGVMGWTQLLADQFDIKVSKFDRLSLVESQMEDYQDLMQLNEIESWDPGDRFYGISGYSDYVNWSGDSEDDDSRW